MVSQGLIKEVANKTVIPSQPSTVQDFIVVMAQTKLACDKLGGLLNELASCYLDSTLLALLIKDNSYITDYILKADLSKLNIVIGKGSNKEKTLLLKNTPIYPVSQNIQAALIDIKKSIFTGKIEKCSLLRKHLDDYQKLYLKHIGPLAQINWLNDQQEPLDVMLRLDTIFSLPDTARVSLTSYGTNKKGSLTDGDLTEITNTEKNVPVKIITDVFSIADISGQSIVNKKNAIHLNNLINTSTLTQLGACNYFLSANKKKAYNKRVENLKFLQAPFLYVHLNRIADQTAIGGAGKVKITTPIVPTESLALKDNAKLSLVAVIIHHGNATGGHYTCYLKCEDIWYLYNDAGYTGLVLIGTFEQLLKTKADDILSNATDFFYM